MNTLQNPLAKITLLGQPLDKPFNFLNCRRWVKVCPLSLGYALPYGQTIDSRLSLAESYKPALGGSKSLLSISLRNSRPPETMQMAATCRPRGRNSV